MAPKDVGNIGRVAGIKDPQGAVLGVARINHGDPSDNLTSVSGQIVWNELLSLNVPESITFYQDLAGYTVEKLTRNNGIYTILKSDSTKRAGILKNPIEYPDAIWLTYFRVNDLDKALKKVTKYGGQILMPPSPEVRHGSMALILDPSGALLALQKNDIAQLSQGV